MTRSSSAMLAVGAALGVLLGTWSQDRDRAALLALRTRLASCREDRASERHKALAVLRLRLGECRAANRSCAAAVEAVARESCGWTLRADMPAPLPGAAMRGSK